MAETKLERQIRTLRNAEHRKMRRLWERLFETLRPVAALPPTEAPSR